MKKDIQSKIQKLNSKHQRKSLWKKIVGVLSCIISLITIYSLTNPALTFSFTESPETSGIYKFHIKDNYKDTDETTTEYNWKIENNYTTEYILDLYYEDEYGNTIQGKNLELELSPDNLTDEPYAFGYIPLTSENATTTRGKDLIDVLNIEELVTTTGEKYEFVEAQVYVNDTWQTFSNSGTHWHIWCQYASYKSTSENEQPQDYGWRGKYGEDNTLYEITNNTKYKLIYKQVRYGLNDTDKNVTSLGADSGITFKIFNYTGDNDETGINNNGVYNYFTFRDSSRTIATTINTELDADGFVENRTKVLSKLDSEGNPIFDCQNTEGCTNFSLGYLFGSNTNPKGTPPIGVTTYSPTNTLLQKENIDNVDYYYYDSNRNAVDYDSENERFMVRNYVERGQLLSGYSKESLRYEFMPFNYWNDNKEILTNTTSNLNYHYPTSEIDHWYGVTMEFEFYMPKDGTINGKDMIFSFSGDDDVWVFIDNTLVLDLGGTHGSVDGTINFKTGEVLGYLNWNGTNNSSNPNRTTIYDSYTNANTINTTTWQNTNAESGTTKIFENYTKHTLKFFYLERGAAVANCKIRFNIPVLPSGSLSIQKQFKGTDNYNDSYEFTIYDITSGTSNPVPNTKYLMNNTEYTTNEYGKFTLKVGEEAIFKLLNEHTYYVEETNTGSHAISHSCLIDGATCQTINKTDVFTIAPESSHQAIFTNKVKTYNLKISKIAYNSHENEIFEFSLNLKDSTGSPVDIENDTNFPNEYIIEPESGTVTFNLKNNENVTIIGIPIDTKVILKEIKHDGYQVNIKEGDLILANDDTTEFTMDSNKDITIYNIPGIVLPETGGPGMLKHLLVGFILILISIKYGYSYITKQKEGDE